MPRITCLEEFRLAWLPHVTDAGLARLTGLLESASPMLIRGAFTQAVPMGCIASHVAWHHPRCTHLMEDAGVMWLTRVAGLNPATSTVITEWDQHDPSDWSLRLALLAECRAEAKRRQEQCESMEEDQELLAIGS